MTALGVMLVHKPKPESSRIQRNEYPEGEHKFLRIQKEPRVKFLLLGT